ncbi:M48 family metallopeptidase [Lachnospiraceae bacterium 62-35]
MDYHMNMAGENPLQGMPFGFQDYVKRRKSMENSKLSGNGLPDYAFSMDFELRKKLDAIPQLYNIGKKICGTVASRCMQEYNRAALLVGPDQFPDVYQIGCDCARRLGIGIPNIYIVNDPSLNAFTYATDDIAPLIVVHSGLYERFTPGELRCVIGHECGHIHNQHGVYNMLGQILLTGGLQAMVGAVPAYALTLLTVSSQLALSAWSRAAEVTCDRAGLICCERVEDAYQVNAKLMYGAALGEHNTVNLDALRSQLELQMSNMAKMDELWADHPSSARRIVAEMEFAECEVFYRWRPELKSPGQIMRIKEETDGRCRRFVDVMKKG